MVSIENPVEIQLSLGNPIYRGPEGKKPVKGVDYFTQEDIDSIVAQIEGGEGIDLDRYATKEYVNEAVESIEIPETDLTDYATKIYVDSAIEGVVVEETDPTVPSWAKQPNKPTYTAQEVGALPANTALFSGDYNDLSNKPTLTPAPIVIQATIAGQPIVDNNGNYRIPLAITSNNMAEAYTQYQTHPSTVGIAIDLTAMGLPTKMYMDCESFYRNDDGNGGYAYLTFGEFNDSSITNFGYAFQNINVCLSTNSVNDSYGTVIGVVSVNQLADYATQNWVSNQHYLTSHQSLTDYATKSYVETAIRGAESGLLKRSVVQALPVSDIDEDTIYMVAKTGSTGDVYDEYLYVNSNWEHIGSTDVDLTDYKKFIQINSNITYNYNDDTITALKQYFSSNSVRAEFPQIYFDNSLVFFTYTYSNAEYRGLPCLYYLSIGDYGRQQEFKQVQPTCDGDNVRYNITHVIKQYSSDDVVVPKNYTVSNSSYDKKLSYELKYIKNNYATQSYVDTSMPEYLTNTDILAIWNGNNE